MVCEPTERRTIDIDGHRLVAYGYNLDKTTTPLVFIHGVLVSMDFWPPVMTRYVLEHHPWWTLTLPAHAPAEAPPSFHRYAVTADLFYRLTRHALDRLVGDERCVLVGHSMGGFVALNFAARSPERLKGAVSIGGFARGQWGGIEGFLVMLARRDAFSRWLFRHLYGGAARLEPLYRLASIPLSWRWRRYIRHPLLRPTFRTFHHDVRNFDRADLVSFFAGIGDLDIRPELPNATVPTLVIAGDRDPIVSFAHAQSVAALLPDVRFEVLKDVGHMPFFEDGERYHEVMTAWLKEVVKH